MNRSQWIMRSSLLPAMLVLTLSACAGNPLSSSDGGQSVSRQSEDGQPVSRQKESDYLPFSIRFDREGNPVVIGPDGEPREFKDPEYPKEVKAIRNIQSLTFVEYEGSHGVFIVRNGRIAEIKLPH